MKTIKVSYGGFETEQCVDDCLYNAIYNKAIDDFMRKLGTISIVTFNNCEMIADQLKAGVNNG